MTNTDIYKAIEAVLIAKGCSPAWIEYALPDIHVEVTNYASERFHEGYMASENGEGCGAYDPPSVGSVLAKIGLEPYTPPWAEGAMGLAESLAADHDGQTLGQALAEHGTGGDTYT